MLKNSIRLRQKHICNNFKHINNHTDCNLLTNSHTTMSQCVNIIFVVLLQITFNVNCVEERAIIVNEDTYLYGVSWQTS